MFWKDLNVSNGHQEWWPSFIVHFALAVLPVIQQIVECLLRLKMSVGIFKRFVVIVVEKL